MYNISCQDNIEYLREIPDESIQLVITSPPYNIGKSYEKRKSLDIYLDSQREVISECVRILKPEGSICWQVGTFVDNNELTPLDIVLFPIFSDYGLKLRNRIIWTFGGGLTCRKRLSGRYETINWWTKTDEYVWNLDSIRIAQKYPNKKHFKGPNKGKPSCNPKGKNPSDVWEIVNVHSHHVEKTIHPCQFPVELAERLVLSMSNEGDKVLDPYMGVGSSVIAAVKNGRDGYGCDISKEYVRLAEERLWKLEQGTLETRPMGKPIQEPGTPKSSKLTFYTFHEQQERQAKSDRVWNNLIG